MDLENPRRREHHIPVPGKRRAPVMPLSIRQENQSLLVDAPRFTARFDGAALTSLLIPGLPATVQVRASTNGVISAWVDFNSDGSWAGAGERIFTNLPVSAGVSNLTFNVPLSAAQSTNNKKSEPATYQMP
jgi:hypothetical protein